MYVMSSALRTPRNLFRDDARARGASGEPVTVMIAAFDGWNDAGAAASEALEFLGRQFETQDVPVEGLDRFIDYSQHRPVLTSHSNGTGDIQWPGISVQSFTAQDGDLRILLVRGPEPSFAWKEFTEQLLGLAKEHHVQYLLQLGSLLAEVPHTRPLPLSLTSYDRFLRNSPGIQRQTYSGPTGIVGVLAHSARNFGIADLSAWVSIPHYAGHPPHPKATYALLQCIERLLDVPLPLKVVEDEVFAWERGAAELMDEEPELAAYVSQLEADSEADPLDSVSGEDIAAEFEQFLKRRDR